MAWINPFNPTISTLTGTDAGGKISTNLATANPVINRAFVPSPTFTLLVPTTTGYSFG